jgi:hypothetical protein
MKALLDEDATKLTRHLDQLLWIPALSVHAGTPRYDTTHLVCEPRFRVSWWQSV